MAHATGMTIRDDTINAPTLRAATDTVIAVSSVITKLIFFTGTPASTAPGSSNVINISSLYNNKNTATTMMVTIITITTSVSVIATILPNRKELNAVPSSMKPDNTLASPIPTDIIIDMDISAYFGNALRIPSMLNAAIIQTTTAPTIGLIPRISPSATPASEVCDNASPIIDNRFNTTITPISGMITARRIPTRNAFCINAY